jgi:hypothetical protein
MAPEPRLRVIEVPVVVADELGPGRIEYNDQLGDDARARIEALRIQARERSLALANGDLAPFGYRLEPRSEGEGQKTRYDLYRQGEGEPLLASLASILRISVNASGTEFVLTAESSPGDKPQYMLVSDGQIEPWDPGPSALLPPAYVGDALASIATTGFPTITYKVELGTQVVYTGTAVAFGAYMPLRSFTAWDGHWVLEVDDHLIMDGLDVGRARGYDAAFGFERIGGESFYFVEQNGQARISYGDRVLPTAYETVFHNQCCEASIHNVEAGPDAVWFHALRQGMWYLVEASLDE